MTPVGLVRNPRASRAGPAEPPPPGCLLVEPPSLDALPAALARLAAAGVRVVVVEGGDGTLREVASRLGAAFGPAPPPIGVIPRGNVDLVARRLGALPGRAALVPLAARLAAGEPAPARPVAALRVAFDDGRPPVVGWIAGWGAYARATRAAQGSEPGGARQVAGAFLSALRAALGGPQAAAWRGGVPARIAIDDGPSREGPRFVGVVTALPGRLVAGLSPFWGDGDGPLRWLDVDAPPRRMALAAPFVAFGRPPPWPTPGYRSGRARRLRLHLDGDLVIDGEAFPGGALTLSATELDFLTP